MKALPDILPAARPFKTFGDTYPGFRDLPDHWARGGYCRWPDAEQGLIVALRVTESVWTGKEPPRVCEDIEGSLWLQGRLWTSLCWWPSGVG